MSIARPPVFRLADHAPGRLTLASDQGDLAHVFVLEPDIVRVMVLPGGRLRQPKTWTVAPGMEDVPAEGRDRFDLAGFSLPDYALDEDEGIVRIETDVVRLQVRLDGFFCSWAIRDGEAWRFALRDRPTQAYDFGWWDGRPSHYLRREPAEVYLGLGERSGAMDRAGRRLRLTNLDAMGYSARASDPLYKHIPFYVTTRPPTEGSAAGPAFGLFYDTLSDCVFDFGQELDNYHGAYRGFVAEHGDLDYYFVAGPQLARVVRRFTWLTGVPALMPRWGLGYSGSTMSYTDAPDAQARMAGFLDGCERHDILCDSFHLSSGYTSIGERRYVFHWNRDKFPDPAGFAQSYADRGVRLCANIKPCLLHDHPLFEEARARGLLIAEADGEPAWVQFWDAAGAYLDFTRPEAADWWRQKVTTALLDQGIAATWNDNNEFEIASPKALAHGFGAPRPAWEAKPLQTLLMLKASREAQAAHAPGRRPYLVSRAGAAGMQRYVQTWSGDNSTSWETLRFNLKMGLGLALSGVSNTGHDVGGFSGPAPDAELFVRWVQFGVFMPRFSIHSWNDDGSVNEPWMHPEATVFVRDLIRFRYRLIPYLYDLLFRHHRDFEPVVRPLFHDFPDDPGAWADGDEMMVGPALLAAPVVEPGRTERQVRPPAGADWIDVWTGARLPGGREAVLPAPWDRPPLLGRAGTAIPLNLAEQHFGRPALSRGLMVFPPGGEGAWSGEVFDDDGETWAFREGGPAGWAYAVEVGADVIEVAIRGLAGHPAPPVEVVLPPGEARALRVR
ncbi:MAG: glycoside hydrolase family 31 protein [Caulobacteraceae bacterium]|nr:glycoside hydrolase family 31 protein [Caulobacteraceae bacterium]